MIEVHDEGVRHDHASGVVSDEMYWLKVVF